MEMPIPLCAECMSTNIGREATLKFNHLLGKWEVFHESEGDYFCRECDAEFSEAIWVYEEVTKVEPQCSKCGGTQIYLDAWADWDWRKQEWALHSTHGNPWCDTCEGTCTYSMVESNKEP